MLNTSAITAVTKSSIGASRDDATLNSEEIKPKL